MKTIARLALIGSLTLLASGCVYVNGENIATDDWKDEQVTNREAISRLSVGASRTAVIEKLGTPNDSEAFVHDDEEVRVLFYRTSRKHADGETSRDETTPLVFKNDRLIGWGERVYEDLR